MLFCQLRKKNNLAKQEKYEIELTSKEFHFEQLCGLVTQTTVLEIETRNSKGRSGSDFYWFLKIYFAAFSHQSFGGMQIWLTHQSKAIILYFDIEIFLSPVLEILRKIDKVNFTSSNLMCAYTHINFQNMKFCLSGTHKISKKRIQKYFLVKMEYYSFRLMG